MSAAATVWIGQRQVGGGAPCFVIAEAGVNHNGDAGMAHRLVDAAADAGADAVKFQTFDSAALVSSQARKAGYQLETTGSEDTGQLAMLKALELSAELHQELMDHCAERGILFLSTPYDWQSACLLQRLQVQAVKIASTDTTNLPFLRQLDGLGLPLVLSTGMCDMDEVRAAVSALSGSHRGQRLLVLQCTSQYPLPEDQVNLRAMQTMAAAFGCPVGYSDHTSGVDTCVWAVAAGATMVEKHFTLDRSLPGPDHRASLEPDGLASMIASIRRVETVLGNGIKTVQEAERDNKIAMQKSLVLVQSLPQGAFLAPSDLTCKRPASGLSPALLEQVTGRRLARDVEANRPLLAEDLEDGDA